MQNEDDITPSDRLILKMHYFYVPYNSDTNPARFMSFGKGGDETQLEYKLKNLLW